MTKIYRSYGIPTDLQQQQQQPLSMRGAKLEDEKNKLDIV
jgi:hypothetical protein